MPKYKALNLMQHTYSLGRPTSFSFNSFTAWKGRSPAHQKIPCGGSLMSLTHPGELAIVNSPLHG